MDASALVDVLVERSGQPELLTRVMNAGSVHVPHLVDSEIQHALRGLVAGQKLSAGRARDALADLDDLRLVRYPAHPLAGRVWELRANLTTYDATYLALAEALECPLVTCDRKLARGARSDLVEVY